MSKITCRVIKRKWTLVFLLFGFGIFSVNAKTKNDQQTSSSPSNKVKYLNAPGTEKLNLPFSDAVRVNNMLYLSGKIGNVPGSNKLASGGIQGETKQALDNIKTSLKQYGLDMDNIVKCTIFMQDMSDWGNMNKVYVTYFPKHKPARSALGVNGLALGAVVEIECLASF